MMQLCVNEAEAMGRESPVEHDVEGRWKTEEAQRDEVYQPDSDQRQTEPNESEWVLNREIDRVGAHERKE
jgi:hypothetical protein